MEQEVFPEMVVSRVGKAIDVALDGLVRVFHFLPEIPLSRGDHTFPSNHGATVMLDEALDGREQPTL